MQQQQQLQMFRNYQRHEMEHANEIENHQLPLAQIPLFAKACELFTLELTIRSWLRTEENKRRTLHKNDIAAAITCTDIFDFLVYIGPREEIKEEAGGLVGLKSWPAPPGFLTTS